MTKKWIIAIVSTIIVGIIFGILLWKFKPQAILFITDPKAIDSTIITENEWTPHTSVKPEDTTHLVEVTYDQKYGRRIQIYCMAVFENKKENRYKCIAPWLGKKEIERANINDFQTRIVLRSEIPTRTFISEKSQ